MKPPISLSIDDNERGTDRINDLLAYIASDKRFSFDPDKGYKSLDVDLRFEGVPKFRGHDLLGDVYSENAFNVELKLVGDYVASALGPDGHLAEQVTTMRELGSPCAVVVLGNDSAISAAIKDSLKTRYHGKELGFEIASYEDRLINFESNCEVIGCNVHRWGSRPWKRLLSLSHKVLTGGSIIQYGPKASNGDRQVMAMTLAKGIGEKTARALLQEYGSIASLCAATEEDLSTCKADGRKIGLSKAQAIRGLLHREVSA